jgi:hypothetical protein
MTKLSTTTPKKAEPLNVLLNKQSSGAEYSRRGDSFCVNQVTVVHGINRMKGQTRSQLVNCSDGNLYVIKTAPNPEHRRVLANELLATLIGACIWLPFPAIAIVRIPTQLLLALTEGRCFTLGAYEPEATGSHFGSRYAFEPRLQTMDFMPPDILHRLKSTRAFAGMLAFDKWMGNVDDRQAIFTRIAPDPMYSARFIDQSMCFNGAEWSFPDIPLRGCYEQNEVYTNVTDWGSFEPWLSRIETLSPDVIWAVANSVPANWYDGQERSLDALINTLIARRAKVRDLILAFRRSNRNPFPNWRGNAVQQVWV